MGMPRAPPEGPRPSCRFIVLCHCTVQYRLRVRNPKTWPAASSPASPSCWRLRSASGQVRAGRSQLKRVYQPLRLDPPWGPAGGAAPAAAAQACIAGEDSESGCDRCSPDGLRCEECSLHWVMSPAGLCILVRIVWSQGMGAALRCPRAGPGGGCCCGAALCSSGPRMATPCLLPPCCPSVQCHHHRRQAHLRMLRVQARRPNLLPEGELVFCVERPSCA